MHTEKQFVILGVVSVKPSTLENGNRIRFGLRFALDFMLSSVREQIIRHCMFLFCYNTRCCATHTIVNINFDECFAEEFALMTLSPRNADCAEIAQNL